MKRFLTYTAAALMAGGISAPAMADDHSGEELRGQTVDIQFADGTRNTVFFGSTGLATITNQTGQSARVNWLVQGNQLCLRDGTASECFSYTDRFVAGRATPMSSSCNSGSVWTARNVNPPREAVAPDLGERG